MKYAKFLLIMHFTIEYPENSSSKKQNIPYLIIYNVIKALQLYLYVLSYPGIMQHIDLTWAIGLNRFALRVAGLWPEYLSPRDQLFSNLRTFLIFTLMTFLLVIPGYASLIRVFDDMMSVIDNLQVTLPITVALMKLVIMWYKKEALCPIVNMITQDWIRAKSDTQRQIMIKQANRARILNKFGYILMIITVSILIVPPCFGVTMRYVTNITDPGRPLIYQTYYPFDVTISPFFELILTGQAVATMLAAFSYTGIDHFLGVAVFHISAQMETLAEQFTNLKAYKDFNSILITHVKQHIRLIRCVDTIENTFNLMLLGLLVYFAILFCLQGFLVVTVINQGGNLSITRLSWLVSVTVNVLVHMAIYCIVGEVLLYHNEAIHHAAYNNEWYLHRPVETKNLIIIMLRTDRPLYITAGKMFPMTMSTFCNVLKTSAGYISVLVANRN